MRRLISFLLPLSLLVFACAPQTTPTDMPEAILPTATATLPATEEAQVQPLSVETPQGTPLPPEIDAPILESPSIVNIEMLDEVFGWALTEQNIIRTNDGGATWHNVTPPGMTDAGYLVFADFLDADHAWVQSPDMNRYPNGGTLYRTSDGGLTWESFDTPFSGGSIRFVDRQTGWVLADLGVGAGSMAVSVFKTNDGGAAWERVYTNDPNLDGAGETLPLGGIKNFIHPLDANIAWVGGVIYAPGETYLFRSDDGGRTWFDIRLVLPEGSSEAELTVLGIEFPSANEGLLALRKSSDTTQILVYRTSDGGNTWEQLPVDFSGYGILDTPSASELVYYSSDQFYVTNDAGRTVRQVAPEIPFGDSIADMSFANSQTGWVLVADPSGARILYKTTDSGATWTQLVP